MLVLMANITEIKHMRFRLFLHFWLLELWYNYLITYPYLEWSWNKSEEIIKSVKQMFLLSLWAEKQNVLAGLLP